MPTGPLYCTQFIPPGHGPVSWAIEVLAMCDGNSVHISPRMVAELVSLGLILKEETVWPEKGTTAIVALQVSRLTFGCIKLWYNWCGAGVSFKWLIDKMAP